jgi:glycerol kinase
MTSYVMAMDQGTTSSRAIVFDDRFSIVGLAQQETTQHYPHSGWVEHDAEEIWATSLATCRQALSSAGIEATQLAAIGITNQRETTIIWDRATGNPIHRAIVWQDRRTAEFCNTLREQGHDETISAKTGLLIDPYFSATKIPLAPGTRGWGAGTG